MVVVSGSWVKNVAVYPTPTVNDMVITGEQSMAAKAVLICRQNSHHFNDRTLTLDQPIKIGRSVARAKATSTNAIFDCKVLSRHHALLWYEEGKFYLQDTQSSNGTFVNNIRLSADTEHHEVSSGDIVQFGVDVVENNRKVTHGCIVATLKLYLPDGKEAKASPTITEADRHGMVPLDDLYKLNQVIQEAKQREQCLETKLSALQRIVDSTRRSADESWQAYVGEERLLSRVSALESQLHQASKNFGEDRIREELSKVQEHNEAYQIAAKEALEKIHAERLEAVALATEQERARITSEQEALLAKEQLAQAQMELEEVAQKLTEEQKAAIEERKLLEEKIQELEVKLEEETVKYYKLLQLNTFQDDLEKSCIIYNDVKKKEELLLAENEEKNEEIKSNGIQNHITLSVRPVKEDEESQKEKEDKPEDERVIADVSPSDVTMCDEDEGKSEVREPLKQVHFNLPEDKDENTTSDGEDIKNTLGALNDTAVTATSTDLGDEKAIGDHREKSYHVDSKTLKYQFQSQQNELKKRIEILESLSNVSKLKIAELDRELSEERAEGKMRLEENASLKEELAEFKHRLKESCNEGQELRDTIDSLALSLHQKMKRVEELDKEHNEKHTEKEKSTKLVSLQQLVNVEEELVLLKERFALTSEEKLKLQHDLLSLTQQYNNVCNRSYNKHFFYVAPLVIMVLYLLVSAMIS